MKKYLDVADDFWECRRSAVCFEDYAIMITSIPIFILIFIFKIITVPYWIYRRLKEIR